LECDYAPFELPTLHVLEHSTGDYNTDHHYGSNTLQGARGYTSV